MEAQYDGAKKADILMKWLKNIRWEYDTVTIHINTLEAIILMKWQFRIISSIEILKQNFSALKLSWLSDVLKFKTSILSGKFRFKSDPVAYNFMSSA